METFEYSKKTLISFVIFIAAFVGMVYLLGEIGFKYEAPKPPDATKADLYPILTSLPFIAFYLVVLLAASAGYARSAIMADKLPISKLFKAELQNRSMQSPSVTTKVRSGMQARMEDNIIRTLANLISSRLPLIAVVDEQNKVIGAFNGHELAQLLLAELDKNEEKPFEERVKIISVKDASPKMPVVATTKNNLKEVWDLMIKHQITKMIVVDNETDMKFIGTVDMLDIIGEIISNGEDKHQ